MRDSKGRFIKGQIAPQKGKKLTEEHKNKLRIAHMGKSGYWKGKKRPDIAGKNYWNYKDGRTKILKNCISCGQKVRNYRNKYCIKCVNRGKNNWAWKGGISTQNEKDRKSYAYKKWRKLIFERDDYTCQICNKKGDILNADHIKRFADYPSLRFELSNGRTLCKTCHMKTSTYGAKKKEVMFHVQN